MMATHDNPQLGAVAIIGGGLAGLSAGFGLGLAEGMIAPYNAG